MKTSRIIAASALALAIAAGAAPAGAAGLTPPANDDIAHAATLPGENNSIKGSNVGATTEAGEPSHGDQLHPADNSVWYRWTAPRSGRVIFRTLGSNFDTTLAAYTSGGDPVSTANLTQRAANDDVVLDNTIQTSQLRVKVNQGDVLFLAVDGFGAATGDITLTWTTNDDFVAAQPLPGPTAGSFSTAAVHNEGATPELGEPRHSGKPAVTSVWYSWTAPFSGIANFQATKSTYDSILAVYTGDRVDALTTVAFNDNVAGGDPRARVLFPAKRGHHLQDRPDRSRQRGRIPGDQLPAHQAGDHRRVGVDHRRQGGIDQDPQPAGDPQHAEPDQGHGEVRHGGRKGEGRHRLHRDVRNADLRGGSDHQVRAGDDQG